MATSTAKLAPARTNSQQSVQVGVVVNFDGDVDSCHNSKAPDSRAGSECNFSTDKGPPPRELTSFWTKKPDWRKPVAKSLCFMAPIREESTEIQAHEGGPAHASSVCGDFRMQVDDIAKTASDLLDQRMRIQSGASDLEWQGQALIKALVMCRDIAGHVGKISSCMEARMDLKSGDKELSDLAQIFAGSLRAESEARSLEDMTLNQEFEDLCVEIKGIHIPRRLADLEASQDMAIGRVDQCVALLENLMKGGFETVKFQRRLSALEAALNEAGVTSEFSDLQAAWTSISSEGDPSGIDALTAGLQMPEPRSHKKLMPKVPAKVMDDLTFKVHSPFLTSRTFEAQSLWRSLGESRETSAIQF